MISLLATSFGLAYSSCAFSTRTTYSSGACEGVQVMVALQSARNDLLKTHTFGGRNRTLSVLRNELMRRCGVDGWNGYAAKAVKNDSIESAIEFVNTMPLDLKEPKARVVPDGNVVFSWKNSKSRLCSVVFEGDGRYHCASVIGDKQLAITTNSKGEIYAKAMEVFV